MKRILPIALACTLLLLGGCVWSFFKQPTGTWHCDSPKITIYFNEEAEEEGDYVGTYQQADGTIKQVLCGFDQGSGILINEKKIDRDGNAVYSNLFFGYCSYRDDNLVVEVIRNHVDNSKELVFKKIADS